MRRGPHPPWTAHIGRRQRRVEIVKLHDAATPPVDKPQACRRASVIWSSFTRPRRSLPASRRCRLELPVALPRRIALEGDNRIVDGDGLDLERAGEQSGQRHLHINALGRGEFLFLKPRKIGDMYVFAGSAVATGTAAP